MQGYATSTGTRRNLEALRRAGWHLLVTPDAYKDKGMRYALDNGAYGCWLRKEPFDERRFRRLLERKGPKADWVVVPDIVAAGPASLDFSLRWLFECQANTGLVLLAVQDGMTPDLLAPLVGDKVGIFIGGTTDWKLQSMPAWGRLARASGCYLHVGRVNTRRRIRYCADIGAHSFDGTSVSRYAKELEMLDAERRQVHLPW